MFFFFPDAILKVCVKVRGGSDTATLSAPVRDVLWAKTSVCVRACRRRRVFVAVSSPLASQVRCENEKGALEGAADGE